MEMYGNIEESVVSAAQMGNLSDLVDFALTVTTSLESSLGCFVWKPAHCEVLSYGSVLHRATNAFVEKYLMVMTI